MSASVITDIIIVVCLCAYVLSHIREGFLPLAERVVALIGAAVLAFGVYGRLGALLLRYWPTAPEGIVMAASFLVAFVLIELALKLALSWIFSFVPASANRSRLSQVLAVIPAFVDGTILIALILFVIVASPFFLSAKGPIEESRVGSVLVAQASGLEGYIDQVFGPATQESLGFLTVEPKEGQSISLPYKPLGLTLDTADETQMLADVNAERAKAGLKPLVMDEKLQAVARAHSRDMWERQYFAHDTPDGLDPFARMTAGGVSFTSAGENLALARSEGRAMEGLMNSPGHRANILDPSYTKVGVGVIDGGIYGKMFTQDFTN